MIHLIATNGLYLLLSGCVQAEPTKVNTESTLVAAKEAVPVAEQGALMVANGDITGSLNVHSSIFGIIYRAKEGCYSDVEISGLSVPDKNAPLKTRSLECTPFMNDPAWAKCSYKEITKTVDGRCMCHMPGDSADSGVEIGCPDFHN